MCNYIFLSHGLFSLRVHLLSLVSDVKVEVGQRMGIGVHYPKESRGNPTDKDQQLVLVFVTIDTKIRHARVVLQPEGGFYPIVILTKAGQMWGSGGWGRAVRGGTKTNSSGLIGKSKQIMSFINFLNMYDICIILFTANSNSLFVWGFTSPLLVKGFKFRPCSTLMATEQ